MLFKALKTGGVAPISGGQWSLPTKRDDGTWIPGEWMPVVGSVALCRSGYHLCELEHLVDFLQDEIYEAEVHPDAIIVRGDNKIAVSCARLVRRCEGWTPRSARLFAVHRAEAVLNLFENVYPDDDRPRKAIEAARKLAEALP
jgi:hypothetical protein